MTLNSLDNGSKHGLNQNNKFKIIKLKKSKKIMSKWNWKQWTALGVIVAVIIAAVVCHLVQPTVSYAWLEAVSLGTFALGALTGYLLKKNNIINSDPVSKKQLLTD